MKKHFYYDNEGYVCMYADGLNESKFNVLELEVSQEELDKITEGYIPKIRDGTLILEESDKIEKKMSIIKLKDDLQKATKVEELKTIINKLLEQ